MGAIEETRKSLQDFVAPELCAITVRLDALEKRVDGKFDKIDQRLGANDNRFSSIDLKLNDMEQKAERRHQQLLTQLERNARYEDILERLARLESKDSHPQ